MENNTRYFIQIRQVADGLSLVSENGRGKPFASEEEARAWGRENLNYKYIAMWEVLPENEVSSFYKI